MLCRDIVIIDQNSKPLHDWELTVPFETNIEKRNTDKNNKYAYLITDVTTHKVNVTAFEIGVRGHITTDNNLRLKDLFKFCRKDTKFKTFKDNISSLAITSSYYLFCSRKELTWSEDTPAISPIF